MQHGFLVNKSLAESARKLLILSGALDFAKKPKREGTNVIFPLNAKPANSTQIHSGLGKSVQRNFAKVVEKPNSLQDALKGKMPEKQKARVTKSFDIIGDIAVVEIPRGLSTYSKKIAKAAMQVHRNVKTVLAKSSAMEGTYRVRRFAHLAGEKRTQTTYCENGVRLKVDLAKMYFSPRLSTERLRIARLSRPNEKILVMFAGCGPFALSISKLNPSSSILGVEINPDAVRYFNENIILNKANNVKAICGDVARVLATKAYLKAFDRIVMPLPKDAEKFLEVALKCAKPGASIHLYSFVHIKGGFSKPLDKISLECKKEGYRFSILGKRVVRPFSPSTRQVVIDFVVL
ncbi:class I SAM-dependent methyltransferase family protein [Candidatus Parvarchaeota archaeon]|nr:class I SAM-dependent methyltransferase family protein [Candidatus Parvarchaeota archaeon]